MAGLSSASELSRLASFPSYKKKDGEWSTSQGRIRELEVLFHRSEAELTATLSEKQSLEAEVADAQAQLAKVQAWQAAGQLPSEKVAGGWGGVLLTVQRGARMVPAGGPFPLGSLRNSTLPHVPSEAGQQRESLVNRLFLRMRWRLGVSFCGYIIAVFVRGFCK